MERIFKFAGTQRGKWRRNLAAFENTRAIDLDTMTDYVVAGYNTTDGQSPNPDTTPPLQENIIRSVIETLCSKIASQKVRPYFNTVNGTFRDMQVTKQAQEYFDMMYNELNINKILLQAFQDACIFDRGVIKVTKNELVERCLPWQVLTDPRETSYNSLTEVVERKTQYPVTLLPDNVKSNGQEYCTYWELYTIKKHKHCIWIPEFDYYKEEDYEEEILPYYFLRYTNPIKGSSCQSVVDLVYGIQLLCRQTLSKIKDALNMGNPLKILVPSGSNINVHSLSNRVGEIIEYDASGALQYDPVKTVTDPVMDPQYIQILDKFKQDAYELVGISQLSAMSQKPQGLDSGIALSTMEDIEDARFEVQLNTFIRAHTDIAKMCIKIFPEDAEVLPNSKWRSPIIWKDIIECWDNMSIQFSSASSLSNDPSTKMQQLQQLAAMGIIPQSHIAKLLDMPDLQAGYDIANNAINAVLSIIDEALMSPDGVTEIPIYIPTQMLMDEILNTCLSLRAAGVNNSNKGDIDKLMKLYALAESKEAESMTNAEAAAVQSLNQELSQALPGMMQQAQETGNQMANQVANGEEQ